VVELKNLTGKIIDEPRFFAKIHYFIYPPGSPYSGRNWQSTNTFAVLNRPCEQTVLAGMNLLTGLYLKCKKQ